MPLYSVEVLRTPPEVEGNRLAYCFVPVILRAVQKYALGHVGSQHDRPLPAELALCATGERLKRLGVMDLLVNQRPVAGGGCVIVFGGKAGFNHTGQDSSYRAHSRGS